METLPDTIDNMSALSYITQLQTAPHTKEKFSI